MLLIFVVPHLDTLDLFELMQGTQGENGPEQNVTDYILARDRNISPGGSGGTSPQVGRKP